MPFSMLVRVGLDLPATTSGNDIVDESGRFLSNLDGEWVVGPSLVPILQDPELVPIPRDLELVPILQDPELVPIPRDPELVPIPRDPELVPIPRDPELVPIPRDPELVPIPLGPELVPIPSGPELVPIPSGSELPPSSISPRRQITQRGQDIDTAVREYIESVTDEELDALAEEFEETWFPRLEYEEDYWQDQSLRSADEWIREGGLWNALKTIWGVWAYKQVAGQTWGDIALQVIPGKVFLGIMRYGRFISRIPRGLIRSFFGRGQYGKFLKRLRRVSDMDPKAVIGVRASSITGKSGTTGKAWRRVRTRPGKKFGPSDVDAFVVSDKMWNKAITEGAKPFGKKPPKIFPNQKHLPELQKIGQEWTGKAGRTISFAVINRSGFRSYIAQEVARRAAIVN